LPLGIAEVVSTVLTHVSNLLKGNQTETAHFGKRNDTRVEMRKLCEI
jgi:hypothetical protein